jgi:hypothetical protein
MSVKPLVLILALALLGPVTASAQGPGDLSFFRTRVGPSELIQRTTLVPALEGNLAVEAALEWQVEHGYLTQSDLMNVGAQVSVSGSSITIGFHVPGGPDVVIVLSNGPFFPTELPQQQLMSVTVIRSISNGF